MYGVKEKTWESIKSTMKQYDQIDQVILYGSRAKGTYRNGSDIDLCFIIVSIFDEEFDEVASWGYN